MVLLGLKYHDLNTARHNLGGFGTSTSALAVGGSNLQDLQLTAYTTESWDGTSWTEVNNIATARHLLFSGGLELIILLVLQLSVRGTATEEWAFSGLDPSTTGDRSRLR